MALKAQKEAGVSKKLVGFDGIDKGPIPRHGHEIQDNEGNVIGVITSGTMSPSLGRAVAMGYVSSDFSAVDSEVNIVIRNKSLKAKVCRFPFLKIG